MVTTYGTLSAELRGSMLQSDQEIRERAAALAEEVVAATRAGRPTEWVEEVLGSALLEVARRERERCAAVADHRADLWESSARRMAGTSWPAAARTEAQERRKEAVFIADALRADAADASPPRDA
jgi:hypothetical protein